jgi:hypothetical protein
MKLGRLVNQSFNSSLKKLIQNPKIPIPVSFKLRGMIKKIAEEAGKYYELHNQLLLEFAEKDANGKVVEEIVNGRKTVKIDATKLQDFGKKVKELEDIEVSLTPIKLEELGIEPIELSLSPEDVFNLEFLTE